VSTEYGWLPLHFACANKAPLELIQFLVEKGGRHSVQTTNINGNLPLHFACASAASLEVVQFLVEQWSEAIKSADHSGYLPLHHACKNRLPLDVVEFLVDEWPEAVKILDSDGRAPLDCAKIPTADGGDPMSEVVSLLEAIVLFPFYSRMNM
jgi:ankyrin repeat protein